MADIIEFPGASRTVQNEGGGQNEIRVFFLPYVAMAFAKTIQDGDSEKARVLYERLGYSARTGDDEIYLDDLPWVDGFINEMNELEVLFHNRPTSEDEDED